MTFNDYTPTTNILTVIDRHGQTGFSRKYGIPLRTVQHWKNGDREPPVWVEKMVSWVEDTET